MTRKIKFKFRQYVAGDTLNSVLAKANLTALCHAYLPNCHEIEIVDVFKEPLRALEDGVLMTPILIVLAPPPIRRIVGTLSQTQTVLDTLELGVIAA